MRFASFSRSKQQCGKNGQGTILKVSWTDSHPHPRAVNKGRLLSYTTTELHHEDIMLKGDLV
jgi:hypothetical protein